MDYNAFKKLPFDVALQEAANYSGFTVEELVGVWDTESARGLNKGPSKAGALGDFQIMPTTQASLEQRFNVKFDPMDFHDSLFMGMEVLRENLAHFKNKVDALRAYNGGWDPAKWDNPETAAYPAKVLGSNHPELLEVYAATDKLPAFTQSSRRLAALNESGIVDTSEAALPPTLPEVEFEPLYPETARRLALEQQRAGFAETALDSMIYNTITGKMIEVSQRGEFDPEFNAMSEENKQRIQAAGLYGNDMMMDYVIGARNADDFAERLTIAQERVDLFRRAANNPGYGPGLGMLLGSMADPVGIMASLGTGAAAATALRKAAQIGRAATITRAGAAGGIENAVFGQVLETADNQRFSWSTLLQDASLGAAMGTIGGLMVRSDGRLYSDPSVEVPDEFRPMLSAAARAVQSATDNVSQRIWDSSLTGWDKVPRWDGSVSTNIADFGGPELSLIGRKPIQKRVDESGEVTFEGIPEEPRLAPANAFNSRLGYKPEPTLNSRAYRDLHQQGVITELRSADDLAAVSSYQRQHGSPIPDDAKAVYIPHDDRVYVFRDRLTPEEIKNPMGLVMHEVGVHYGLERAVGTETYGRIMKMLEDSNDVRIQSALRAVPGDTPDHLRLEEALGYLVEKHPDLPLVKRIISEVRNWLRENVRIFRGLAVSVEDAIAYVKGSVEHARTYGRTRGDTVRNSNDMLFSNDALAMAARYSRSPGSVSTLPLSEREKAILKGLQTVNARIDPNMAGQIARSQKFLESRPDFMKGWDNWAVSPGVAMSASPNELARKTGAMFFENSLGSAGRPEDGSVAIHYDLLYRSYRDTTLEQIKRIATPLMTAQEKVDHLLGGTKGMRRLSTEVAEERLRHRMAIQQGRKYVSSAPEGIRKLAKVLDDQMFKMVDDGRAYGSTYADKVFGSGVVGFMPQTWDWRKFHAAQTTDPATWEALRKNFTQQYIEKQIDPVMAELAAKGADPAEVDAVRARLMEQIEHQVNMRLQESVRDPNSRTAMDTGKFETMAADLMYENFQGQNVTRDVVQQFREILADHINDRSRTEFDLLREVDGVRLLDFVEHDLVTTASHTAHRFAGQNAMAKRGFKDYADFEALITLLTKTGARPIDIELTRFAGRAFGFQPMVIGDSPMLATLRNFTYASMLGKLGIAQLADMSAVISATGLGSLPKIFGRAISKESPLVKQLGRLYGPGMIGADYRIQSYVADVLPNGRVLGGMGNRMLKLSQRSAQLVSWINGSNVITRALHKAFLPVVAEDVVRAAQGLDGGMSPARLADIGLSREALDRIKTQIQKYEPDRKEGEAFKWEKWDDQYAADKLVEAIHRATSQVFQRTLIGEAAMWRTESALGSLVGQFHNYGMTAMEKQLGRNLAINDFNAYAAMSIGIVWSSLLYYSRIMLNASGMNASDAEEYIERNTTPARMVNGMLTYFNMSGIGAELFGVGEVLFGGNQYQAGSGPVAAMGYISNAARSLNGIGNIITGSTEDTGAELAKVLRILPGGNSIPGTWMINRLKDE
ncbi:transglycosylase SLT domain-containing protein [Pusillimonas sp.]|uniref:transglycosylase SLT domain-containing protein n=1 Tax=Pusillimonas sp. TaxID=3040095 RepID=UPI0037C8B54E